MEPFVYPAGEAYEKPHHNINLSKYTNYTFENVVSQEHFKVRPSPVEIHTSSKKRYIRCCLTVFIISFSDMLIDNFILKADQNTRLTM